MNDAKYIWMDVHQATISVAVRDSRGNLVLEAILETKAETILQFIADLRGSLLAALRQQARRELLAEARKHPARRLRTSDAPNVIGPYSQAVRGGGFIFVSEQLGLNPASRSSGVTPANRPNAPFKTLPLFSRQPDPTWTESCVAECS
jgi:hypothetical protein